MVRSYLLAALPVVAAWPAAINLNEHVNVKRAEPEPREPLFLSGRQNTGVVPALSFNAADQYVDVTEGSGHEFVAPVAGDIRGQCPGLNAASNHGFLPHNGITTIAQTITGLAEAYNMSPDLALFLAVLSVAISGDPITSTWSIGGAYQSTLPGVPANGIAGTHNMYESDASIVRGDAYLNGGNVGVFQMRSWEHFWSIAPEDDGGWTLDTAAKQSDYVTRWSIMNNPYYFSAPFAGLVSPAAHDFVINFMSNRSEENPGGYLSKEVLKQFFAVEGDEIGGFTHTRGVERIPENWYKRPTSNQYNIPEVVADVLVNNAMYPGIVRFGGNTGKVNSFAGVDITDLSGGAYNLQNLAEGNNGVCFFMQASQQGIPDAALPILGQLGSTIASWASGQLAPLTSKFQCGQLGSYEKGLFNSMPGAGYKANGQSKSFLDTL